MVLAALPASAVQKVTGGPAPYKTEAAQLAKAECKKRGGTPTGTYWYWYDESNWYAYVECAGI
ncbi:hypothetical protein SGFS_021970 [Streptomyces graminofaciens]|uniref:Uncharacterized protein n=1 Tax=Streptomyces graminofaciens TaxID=68212 RepID=A0ABM7F578_9ACTN|nr:hypothetical protein SGFS_021970 [Streptomyces graminofaciens]